MLLKVRTFGENLRFERMRRGITQGQLAAWLSLKQSQISSWEKGRRMPGPDSIERIAAALSREGQPCSPRDLLAGVLTDEDRLRGAIVPAAPPPLGEILTPAEKRALRLFRLASEAGQRQATGLLAEIAKAFPRPREPESQRRSGQMTSAAARGGRKRR